MILKLMCIWLVFIQYYNFPVCLELRMYYVPLTWCEQELLKYKAHFEALPRAPCSLRLFALKVISQRYSRRFYWPVNQIIKSTTQRLQVHRIYLGTAYVRHKGMCCY
jgi:hypothetical protein